MTVSARRAGFDQLVSDWAAADKECGRLYGLWQAACDRRARLATAKNYAWLELKRAEAESVTNGNHQ